MIYTIQNSYVSAAIAAQGAELQSLINKNTGIEYMWGADPAFWAKTSPVLFPVVGGLKNDQYTYNGHTYTLGRHGFARYREFTVTAQQKDSVTFTLMADDNTLQHYPFYFSFSVTYTLRQNTLHVTYTVNNTGDTILLFSVGGHPAFKVPVTGGTEFIDYYLHFNHIEGIGRWPLSATGQVEKHTEPVLENNDILPLTKQLFYKDALVFKHLKSDAITLKSNKTPHGLTVTFKGFPYMGIWSFKDADFICIEPWCGIADSVDATGNLSEKEGINSLPPGQLFERTWSIEVF
ncbi:MAG TPA: aldose 1-epimerase family protein [Chitinophagaceae bacterium]|nr:aldose 1-epimerase family protein [Chitinophagaceae bacterium]